MQSWFRGFMGRGVKARFQRTRTAFAIVKVEKRQLSTKRNAATARAVPVQPPAAGDSSTPGTDVPGPSGGRARVG